MVFLRVGAAVRHLTFSLPALHRLRAGFIVYFRLVLDEVNIDGSSKQGGRYLATGPPCCF